MRENSWVHFACHGVSHTGDPTMSGLALWDGILDLKTIILSSFKSADIAFLSSCHNTTNDVRNPGEAIHIAGGMLRAGYRCVFTTMWPIEDVDAPVVAKEVYAYLLNGANRGKEAYAMHYAVEQFRNKVGEAELLKWVPFVHFGG